MELLLVPPAISFITPGVLNPKLITTLGVNVKKNSSAIGYFGTGLKYAIAVLLREEQKISIWNGESLFTFFTKRETLRGKDFDFIVMTERKNDSSKVESVLGFTTELGKNWTINQAYRELYANTQDESGEIRTDFLANHLPNTTIITVSGEKIFSAHRARGNFILDDDFKTKNEISCSDYYSLKIYTSETKNLFYRNFAVYTAEKNHQFTYNIMAPVTLSEDRSLLLPYQGYDVICTYFTKVCTDRELLKKILTNKDYAEHKLNFASIDDWSETFSSVVQELLREDIMTLPEEVKQKALREKSYLDIISKDNLYTLTLEEQNMLDEAINLFASRGFDQIKKAKITCVKELPKGVLGIAQLGSQEIILSAKAFGISFQEILFEEFCHAFYYVEDESRDFQNLLLSFLITQFCRN